MRFLCGFRAETLRIGGGFGGCLFATVMVDRGNPVLNLLEEINMVEVEKDYASKGVAGAGLGLGIAGTALGLLSGNGLNGILGWGNCGNAYGGCGGQLVNRYEAEQSARIAELETEVKLRDANVYTMTEMGKLRDYVDRRFEGVNASINTQAVINAQVAANLSCLTNQVNVLSGLTKTVIPIGNVCPEPMPMYNSWTAPTATT